MAITVPPDLEQVIYRQLSSGRFDRVEDVLRAALQNLDSTELIDLPSLPVAANDIRSPDFLSEPDDHFVPGEIPRPFGRMVKSVKTIQRLNSQAGNDVRDARSCRCFDSR